MGKDVVQCTFLINFLECRIYEALGILGKTRYLNRKRTSKRIQKVHHKVGDIQMINM
jgi:hypothetical protein